MVEVDGFFPGRCCIGFFCGKLVLAPMTFCEVWSTFCVSKCGPNWGYCFLGVPKVEGGLLLIPFIVVWVDVFLLVILKNVVRYSVVSLLSTFFIIIMTSAPVFWCNSFAY